ncbi:hypothetical protein L9F63_011211 [Diploptera punctata]|uniref:PAZ domain-containing protein n=1 Tax=Diploptera punctata TaxID=6984 RepID=A0AAD8AF20_DIPPU|nr:hypothetical protein L9F63_011211 [Diploptera punctata]
MLCQHENNILMCAEITHKVMRQDAVLDLLAEWCSMVTATTRTYSSSRYRCHNVGSKNYTYCIDDVDFDTKPLSEFFKLRDGDEISFKEYFAKQYQKRINNDNQPTLVS